jgi:hypothetical protein
MSTGENKTEDNGKQIEVKTQGGSDAVYGFGLIGAWVYYISKAETPEEKVKGFLKGLVWPAFLVYELLEFLHKQE